MALHPGNVQGYNNELVIAGSEAAIVHNPGINESEQISGTGDKSFEGKIAAPAGTDHKGPSSCRPAADPAGHADPADHSDPAGHADPAGQQRVWSRGRDKPRRRKNSSHSRRGRGWPSGALVGISLASPLRPRGEAPLRR